MDSKFFVPIASMLLGIVVFIAFVILRALADKSNAWSPWTVAGVFLVAGGLIVYSSFG